MRGLIYLGPREVEWQERARPKVESAGGAVVRPLAVATCDLDALIVSGESPFPAPFMIGHEGVGEVIEVGDAVRLFKPGDRVLVPFQISCGSCEACMAGRTGNCLTVPIAQTYGFGFGKEGTKWGGFLADAIGVPFADAMLVAVPDQMPSALAASASDNLTDAYRAVGPRLAERPGAPVLVTGGAASGSIGLFAVALAVALGSEEVLYVDEDKGRRAVADGFGAKVLDQVPDRLDRRYPIAVNAASSAASLALCLASLDRDGVCTSTSIAFDPTSVPVFPLLSMYVMSTTFITGRIHARHHAPAVLALLAADELDLSSVLTTEISFDDAAEGLLEPHTKLIMVPAGAA